MDELPELTSDADVDALMARIRSKVRASATAAPPAVAAAHAATGDALGDYLTAQQEVLTTIVRAMQAMTDAFEESQGDAIPPRRRTRDTTPRTSRRGARGKRR